MYLKRHRYLRINLIDKIHLHGMWGVYLNEFFRRIATALIGLYLPIFIWQQTGSLINIPLFFLIFSLSALLMEFPGVKVIQKVGVDWGMSIGSLFRGSFILSLILAKTNPHYLLFSAILYGFSQPFDWLPYHYVITKIAKQQARDGQKKFGKSASISSIMTQSASALGPFIGGMIVYLINDTALYLFASSFLIFSAIAPFLDDFKKKDMHINIKDVFVTFKDFGLYKHVFTFSMIIFNDFFYVMVWPVFLFLTLGGIAVSGAFQTLSIGLALLITYITGRLVDKRNFKTMHIGGLLNIASWVTRFITTSTIGLFSADMAYNFSGSFLWTPVQSLLYKRAGKKYTMEFWLVHEVVWYILQTLVCLFILLVFHYFTVLKTAFILVGIVNISLLLIPSFYKNYIRKF